MGLLGTIPPPSLAIHKYSKIYRLSAGCIQAQLVTRYPAWDSGQTIWDDLMIMTLAVIGHALMWYELGRCDATDASGSTLPYAFCSSVQMVRKLSGARSKVALQNSGYACTSYTCIIFGDTLTFEGDHNNLACLSEQWIVSCATYQHVFANSTRRRHKSGEQPYKRKRTLHLLSNPLHAFSKAAQQLNINVLSMI